MRVRITRNAAIDEGRNGALPFGGAIAANVAITEDAATLTTGELRAMPREIVLPLEPRFPDRRTGAVLLEEEPPHLLWPRGAAMGGRGGRPWSLEQRSCAYCGQRFHEMERHQHERLDFKGVRARPDAEEHRDHDSLLDVLASLRPLVEQAGDRRGELAANRTFRSMEATRQLDHVVATSDAGPVGSRSATPR